MTATSLQAPPLELVPISGPPTDRIHLDPSGPVVLGRSSQCDVTLAHPQLSRKHASFTPGRQVWVIRDLTSRHGTWVNGGRIAPEAATTLKAGDIVQLGPWAFRVEGEGQDHSPRFDEYHATLALVDDDDGTGVTQSVVLGREMARQHLDILLEAIEFAASADDPEKVAAHLAVAARRGGPFRRALVLRQGASDRADIVASDGQGVEEPVSRTLLAAAAEGTAVEVRDLMALGQAQSIIDRGVRQGVCMPFRCGGEQLFLYLDSTQDAAQTEDSALLLDALARTAGLAMERLARENLQTRQRQIEDELHAARRVQQLLMPKSLGETDAFHYALRSEPGRFVAGDLAGVVPLGPRRAAAFLGDVSGKGMAASILMAATQSALQTSLQAGADILAASHSLNEHIAHISAENDFVTLALLVVDLEKNRLEVIDAGHGYIMTIDRDGNPRTLSCKGGIPIGIDAGFAYERSTFPLDEIARLVLFSDGVAEGHSHDRVLFGVERSLEALTGRPDHGADVSSLFEALNLHCEGSPFERDDTTAMSLSIR
jgi:serine phosphatase RsbU (regulator of sigma subunit)